jgi:hypothetical protein
VHIVDHLAPQPHHLARILAFEQVEEALDISATRGNTCNTLVGFDPQQTRRHQILTGRIIGIGDGPIHLHGVVFDAITGNFHRPTPFAASARSASVGKTS